MSTDASVTTDSVVAEVEIAAAPPRVFEALTDARQLFVWWGKEPSVELLSFDIDARVGGRWRFRCRPVPGSDHGSVADQLRRNGATEFEARGEILVYEPPLRLAWSWIANWHQNPFRASVVLWELTPTETGTRVRLTHSGLSQEGVARDDYKGGWIGVLRLLKANFDL
jgi:uncharacterized protein YndB with AHSA1/START domain